MRQDYVLYDSDLERIATDYAIEFLSENKDFVIKSNGAFNNVDYDTEKYIERSYIALKSEMNNHEKTELYIVLFCYTDFESEEKYVSKRSLYSVCLIDEKMNVVDTVVDNLYEITCENYPYRIYLKSEEAFLKHEIRIYEKALYESQANSICIKLKQGTKSFNNMKRFITDKTGFKNINHIKVIKEKNGTIDEYNLSMYSKFTDYDIFYGKTSNTSHRLFIRFLDTGKMILIKSY